ncbi:barstar family protein [Amycolatopsis sp. VS8301801F10]|uniref:barstar family protein n=1 Tax=Amycolatopsis sp. VS8301801F10 TaxID=2652442 RepID=UPI0038FC8123
MSEKFPLYSLVDDQRKAVVVVAGDIEGFFVSEEDQSEAVAFIDAEVSGGVPREIDDAILDVMNTRGDKIGEYPIGSVVFADADAASRSGVKPRVSFRFFGSRFEFPEAREIWRRWAAEAHLGSEGWRTFSGSGHEAWLHVVQNSWFATGHDAICYGGNELANLNGSRFSTPASFYCALGEAVNGPGGYFGSSLDALADCLRSSREFKPLTGVVWGDFDSSEKALGSSFVTAVLGVMREFEVAVDLR